MSPERRIEVRPLAVGIIVRGEDDVDANDFVAPLEERLDEMRAEETRCASKTARDRNLPYR